MDLNSSRAVISKLLVAFLVLATVTVPLALSPYNYSSSQLLLAMVLIDVCLFPVVNYLRRGERSLPALELLCLSYAVQFALPIFTREPVQWAFNSNNYIDESDVISALF